MNFYLCFFFLDVCIYLYVNHEHLTKHELLLQHILASEGPVVWYLDTADEVLFCFEQLYKRYTSGMMNMEPWYTPRFVSNQIGSHKLKMVKDSLPKNINQSTRTKSIIYTRHVNFV